MSLIIRKPGIFTTVQDLGRFGFRRFGINPNGAMDTATVRSINTALFNDENAAVLEMHFPAPEIEFSCNTSFAIGGADLSAELDGRRLLNYSSVNAEKGNILKFKRKISGNRSYLAIKDGIAVEQWLGSASTNLPAEVGGHFGRPLVAGDVLQCRRSGSEGEITIGPSLHTRCSRSPVLRVVRSGEFDLLTALSERTFENATFELTNESNRMGCRLKGEPLHLLQPKELVSSATSFGTVQLLPDSQLIVLMADHQTAGGYPRIANIISADLPIAGQLGPGDRIMFRLVSSGEAEKALELFERDLRFFKIGCQLRKGIQH